MEIRDAVLLHLWDGERGRFVRTISVHPDGMISLDLKGLFMQDLVVVKRPDGSFAMQCVPDSESETTRLAPPPPPRPVAPLEER